MENKCKPAVNDAKSLPRDTKDVENYGTSAFR